MAVMLHYRVRCNTEVADVDVWGDVGSAPTQCPNDAGHEIGTVSSIGSAPQEFFLNDGTDVWKITIDTGGSLVTTKQT